MLTLSRFEFWGQPKVLGVNTLASTKLVGVSSDKCYVLWPTIPKDYGGVRVIEKSAVNLFLIIKFIQYHYNLQRHLD